MYVGAMEEERIEVVAFACHGTVVNWRDSVESVLCRTARRHGEAPLDRGRALRRALEALPARSFAEAFERLAAERGYRWAGPGDLALQRAVAGCRSFPDAAPALEAARAAGVRLVAVSSADPQLVEAALRPLDGAFDAVLSGGPLARAARAIGVPANRVLHVAAGTAGLRAAAALGMRAAWLNRRGAPAPDDATYDFEWRTLEGLSAWLGAQPVGVAPR
jgi:FMN phosphatase YigB (HAD superfamily)